MKRFKIKSKALDVEPVLSDGLEALKLATVLALKFKEAFNIIVTYDNGQTAVLGIINGRAMDQPPLKKAIKSKQTGLPKENIVVGKDAIENKVSDFELPL